MNAFREHRVKSSPLKDPLSEIEIKHLVIRALQRSRCVSIFSSFSVTTLVTYSLYDRVTCYAHGRPYDHVWPFQDTSAVETTIFSPVRRPPKNRPYRTWCMVLRLGSTSWSDVTKTRDTLQSVRSYYGLIRCRVSLEIPGELLSQSLYLLQKISN